MTSNPLPGPCCGLWALKQAAQLVWNGPGAVTLAPLRAPGREYRARLDCMVRACWKWLQTPKIPVPWETGSAVGSGDPTVEIILETRRSVPLLQGQFGGHSEP